MKVVAFVSTKGGVGKSSCAILTANCLGTMGKKVLVIDMDMNNSTSSYYLTADTIEESERKNAFFALSNPDNDLEDFSVATTKSNVDLIPSSVYLPDLRSISDKRLSQMISKSKKYDYILIDTAPSYDNLTLNAYYAADFIITPIKLTQFDFNTTTYIKDKMELEVGKSDNWFLLLNDFDINHASAKSGKQKEYIDLFQSTFGNFTPEETWFPKTAMMKDIIDRDERISLKKYPKLFTAVSNFAQCLFDDDEEKIVIEEF